MAKKERRIVFSVGLLCLLIFTFNNIADFYGCCNETRMGQSLRSYWRNSLYDSVHYGLRFVNPVSVKKEYNSEPFKRFRRRFSSLLSFLYGRVYDLELSFRQSGRDFKKLDSCHWNSYGSSSNLAGNAGSDSLQKPGTATLECVLYFILC